MSVEREYLNEERYQKNKKQLSTASKIVLLIGLLIGGGLIAIGFINHKEVNDKYSEEGKAEVTEKLNAEKAKLLAKKEELEKKGIEYDGSAKYTDGEKYDLYIITNALDPSFSHCKFDEYKNNVLTSKYCSLSNEFEDINDGHGKSMESSKYIPLYMFGAFIVISCGMFSGFLFMTSRGREIAAFSAQQAVPVGKEVIDEMAPSSGRVAKEIAKGIKEALDEDEE